MLQERTDKNGSTKFYVNLGRTCGCKATQTTMVTLHKKATIPLSERQTVAARKVLDKVRALTRPFRLFFSTPRLFLRSCLPLPSSLPPVFVSLFIVTSIELTHTPPCRPTPPLLPSCTCTRRATRTTRTSSATWRRRPAVDMEDLATFLTPVAQQTVMVIPVRQQELQSSRRERGRSLRRARSYSRP